MKKQISFLVASILFAAAAHAAKPATGDVCAVYNQPAPQNREYVSSMFMQYPNLSDDTQAAQTRALVRTLVAQWKESGPHARLCIATRSEDDARRINAWAAEAGYHSHDTGAVDAAVPHYIGSQLNIRLTGRMPLALSIVE